MKRRDFTVLATIGGCALSWPVTAAPTAQTILDKALESDPWGMSGARIKATLELMDKRGTKTELKFAARSRQHAPPLSKSLVRFQAPAEMKGAGFLQIQNKGQDDDRYLFLPELKRARRISGNLRSTSFMGTDFSYADLDRRDLRESTPTLIGEEEVGGAASYHLSVAPGRSDTQYSKVELWVRKDNFLPAKMDMYDKAGTLLKTLTTLKIAKVSGEWFIAQARMVSHRQQHETLLTLESVAVDKNVPDADFTVMMLERI